MHELDCCSHSSKRPEIHTDWRPYSQANRWYRIGRYERRWFRWKLVWKTDFEADYNGSWVRVLEFYSLKAACQEIEKLNDAARESRRFKRDRKQPWQPEVCK